MIRLRTTSRSPDRHPGLVNDVLVADSIGAGALETRLGGGPGPSRARNAKLDELAVACQAKNRWEFMLSLAPWRMNGVISRAVNPVAVF
jgi:hypothetical protein